MVLKIYVKLWKLVNEHVNQGSEDAFQKKINPWLNRFSCAEPYLWRKKLVPHANGVFNIQGEGEKNPNRAWVFNVNLNVYNMTDFNKYKKFKNMMGTLPGAPN